jgi:hypothetical protein
MKSLVYRQNNMFVIDKSQIKASNKENICNALYAAIYAEFIGASENPNYKKQTNKEKMQSLNTFAQSWLKSRGYL